MKGVSLSYTDLIEKLNHDIDVSVYDEIDSTNLELKRRVSAGDTVSDCMLVVSGCQTKGRGRLGRTFESPKDTGVYLSLLLAGISIEKLLLITSAAGVAVCRGIRSISELKPGIKWVNDIYLGDKKVCGILGESVTDHEGRLNVILGIGINVFPNEGTFSQEVSERAGSLTDGLCCEKGDKIVDRNEIVAAVVNNFLDIYNNIEEKEHLKDYRDWSIVIGKNVRYLKDGNWEDGLAVDIDDDGGLIIDCQGDKKVLSTGEITLRINE